MAKRSQLFYRRKLTLFWSLKCRVGDMNGFEKAFCPGFRFCRFKDNAIAILANEYFPGQMNALWQTHGLKVSFRSDSCCFHNNQDNYDVAQNQEADSIRPARDLIQFMFVRLLL